MARGRASGSIIITTITIMNTTMAIITAMDIIITTEEP